MIEALNLFDAYNRQARLYPALISLLPAVFTVLSVFPQLFSSVGGGILSLIAFSGGLYLLADIARSSGKRIESSLVTSWGGWPTTVFLRHSCVVISAPTAERYRRILEAKTNLAWPTPAAEATDLNKAEDVYRSAVDWLREQTRGPEFTLLLSENARYGFRRNLLGLKPWAIGISILASGCLLFPVIRSSDFSLHRIVEALADQRFQVKLAALTGSLLLIMVWLLVVRMSWVKSAAERYALALLSCCDRLK